MISGLAAELLIARTRAQPLGWPADKPADLPTAYSAALAVRAARIATGDVPAGYKVGFTNRTIWPVYGVYAPIWGTVWRSTLTRVDANSPGEGVVNLAGLCEPLIEPEVVFGFRSAPPPDCSLSQLAGAIGWVAHGFEIVHTHFRTGNFRVRKRWLTAGCMVICWWARLLKFLPACMATSSPLRCRRSG